MLVAIVNLRAALNGCQRRWTHTFAELNQSLHTDLLMAPCSSSAIKNQIIRFVILLMAVFQIGPKERDLAKASSALILAESVAVHFLGDLFTEHARYIKTCQQNSLGLLKTF